MKAPSLLLLLAAVAASAETAAPPAAPPPAHRCGVEWLKKAQSTPLGVAIADPDKFLTTAQGQAPTIDVTNPSKLCDASVWHYLAVLAPVGEPILDPKTHQPINGVTLRWNDPALKQRWDTGLAEQIKILLAADDLYQRVDVAGRAALAKADAAVKAAVDSGVVAQKDGAAPGKLDGLTAFAEVKSYEVSPAPAPAAGAPAPSPADLKAAFSQLLKDPTPEAPKAANKSKTAKPAAPATPKPAEPGPAILDFRKSVVALANEARGAHAAFTDADYAAAAAFVTDAAIVKADDDSAHPSAALSGLDYGLRNLLALRIAAVDKSFAAAQERLKGRSVAETLAATGRVDKAVPVNTGAATMAAAVLTHLQGIKDYQDLNALFDKNKDNADWVKSDAGKAVADQLAGLRADAAATAVVKSADGRALQYSIGGQKVTDTGIAVAGLERSQDYRDTIAEAIAQNIASNPLSAQAQAALAAFRGAGAQGTAVAPALTPDQQKAAEKLPPPIAPAIVVTAPSSPYQAMLAASPAKGLFDFSKKEAPARFYSKQSEDIAAAAHAQTVQRAAVEEAANQAAEAAQAKAAAARRAIETAPVNPDEEKALQDQKRADALKAFDAKTAADVAAARQKVVDDARKSQKYVDAAKADADLAARRKALDDTMDAAYSDGINQAVAKLNAAYDLKGSPQRSYAEQKSGYSGDFYKTERVDGYFSQNWKGAKQAAAVAGCKAALGFKKDADSAGFKDPSVDNVDRICGVRDGLVLLLASYKGTVKAPAAAK